MPIEVLMPALSPTMTEGKIAKWHKQPGDKVKAGDILAEIETDKATMEIEAVDEGTFAKIIVPEGTENVAVNQPIAVRSWPARTKSGADAGQGGAGARRKLAPPASRSASRCRKRHKAPSAGRRKAAAPAPPPAACCVVAGRAGMDRPDRQSHGARGAARRDGRGNAARRDGVPDRRGSRGISGRLQGQSGFARGIPASVAASSTHRSRNTASPVSRSAPQWRAFGRSSSS